MRVRSIKIGKWRNLADLDIEIAAESKFICLVGENGSGKSALLEVLSLAAHRMGLVSQRLDRRVPPETRSEPYDVEVKLEVGLSYEDLIEGAPPPAPVTPEIAAQWDGALIFQERGHAAEGGLPHPLEPHTAGSGSPTFAASWRVLAGGIDDVGIALHLGQTISTRLQSRDEVLHLYLDAERVFPPAEVRDEEVLALAREDPRAPQWMRNQAAIVTQNLYLQWMRALLGQQQRRQTQYYQEGLAAGRRGDEAGPLPEEFLAEYSAALQRVLPHLRFVRLDQEKRRLIYDSAGVELPYEELSGGERELAFLVGQVERFGVRDGLFLLDEPELHLNAELLRGWLDYLRDAVDKGQVWIATHALEAAEVAGLSATLVFERDDDRTVRDVAPLGDRPALRTLAGELGTPAFSVGRSRFLLIEGERPGRERERFARLLESPSTDRFIEGGGCAEVLRRLDALRDLASEEEQLQVGGFIDRDFRSDNEIERLEQEHGVCVLPVHEVENFFLEPAETEALARQAGHEAGDAVRLVQEAADELAGQWVWERTLHEKGWDTEQLGPARGGLYTTGWADLSDERVEAAVAVMPCLDEPERVRRRAALKHSRAEYESLRDDPDQLWRHCLGKETMKRLASKLGLDGAEAIEVRVEQLWSNDQVARPGEAGVLKAYIEGIEVLT